MPAQNGVSSNYYSGQGIVLMAQRDLAGNATGFTNIGNCSALSIAVSTSVIEHKEASTGSRGIDLRLTTQVAASINVVMESFSAENIALGLHGTTTAQVGAAVVGEALTAPLVLGQTIALANIGVSALTLTNVGATVTYVLGTDYALNAEAGSITVLAGGAITTGLSLVADYTFASYDQIDALTVAQPERWLRFEGLNTASGNKSVTVDVFRVATDPLAELALIGDTVGQITLAGSALADTSKTTGSKYFRQRILA